MHFLTYAEAQLVCHRIDALSGWWAEYTSVACCSMATGGNIVVTAHHGSKRFQIENMRQFARLLGTTQDPPSPLPQPAEHNSPE